MHVIVVGMWTVKDHAEAVAEYQQLGAREAVAVDAAIAKLEVLGPHLPYPHSSQVKSAPKLRELRPRAGRSQTRVFYSQTAEDTFTIGAYGPEADVDPKGFKRSVDAAKRRLGL